MSRSFIFLIILLAGFTACNNQQESEVAKINYIELVAIGIADTINEGNRGHGIAFYCFLNLANDSVFIQRKLYPYENPQIIAQGGIVKGISKHPTILSFIEAGKEIPIGKIKSTEITGPAFYCGPTYFSKQVINGEERYQYFKDHNLEPRIKLAINLIRSLQNSENLVQIQEINADSVIIPIVSKVDSNFLPPPPPIVKTIKFVPPEK